MGRMRILWLSNYRFGVGPDSGGGTWIGAMGRGLIQTNEVKLANITVVGGDSRIRYQEVEGISQWCLPNWKLKDGLPDKQFVQEIVRLVSDFNPDIIHVWGVENYFGLLVARGYLKGRCLLDMQGLYTTCAKVMLGGLSFFDLFRCLGPKELLRPKSSIVGWQRAYEKKCAHEQQVLVSFSEIDCQSQWMHDQISVVNPDACFHKTKIAIRKEFLEAKTWKAAETFSEHPILVAVAPPYIPYKGCHTLIRAVGALKAAKMISPQFELRLIGSAGRRGLFKSGYVRFLEREIKRLHLSDNVMFTGALPTNEIIRHLAESSVFIHPSFVESYSLATVEAMAVGVPSVLSYAGAIPELGEDGESALYYPSGDVNACAARIHTLLNDVYLSEKLGRQAQMTIRKAHQISSVVKTQLNIYYSMLKDKS